jgi:succinate dehydrogenase/fumarate reductase flavoprotein subunit
VAAADGEAVPSIPDDWRFDPPPAETRDAVWRLAGPLRSADGLEQLLSDPYPLARLIALFALERRESRGSHQRIEFRERDPGVDGCHIVSTGDELRWQSWA